MMEYKNLLDMHVHTDSSPDGEHAAILLCEYALRKGMRAIAFTDHCEVDCFYTEHYDRSIQQAYFEASKARSVFRGSLIVSIGIELGQPIQDLHTSEKIIQSMNYDVILGSVHNVRGKKDFYFLDYTHCDINALLCQYFEEVYEMVQWGGFDVLAHLTYPLRYICGEYKISVDLSKFTDIIDKILKGLAQSGKALEINTSGLRGKIGETSPTLDIVRRFKELGGRYITIGSDAHCVKDVGAGLQEGLAIAKEAGFHEVTLFESRMPIQIEIK